MSALLRGTGTSAFDGLYRRHAATVYRYSLAVLGNHADAEDVTQTTFLNAYRALAQGVKPRKAENWLLTIAHNQIRQHFRRTLGKPMEVELNETMARTHEPEDRTEPSVADVLRALQNLTPAQRSAIVMREFEGRSYAEMAGILGLTPSALEALLFRARRALAEQLEESLSCNDAELSMSRRLDGRLARPEARRLKAHMRECPRCQRFEQAQRRQRKVLKGLSLMPVPASIFLFHGGESAAAAALGAGATAGAGAGVVSGAAVAGSVGAGAGAGVGGGLAGAGIAAGVATGVVAKVAVVTAAAAAVVGGVGYGVTKAEHPTKTDRAAALEQTRRGERARHVDLARRSGTRPGPAATASARAQAATALAHAKALARKRAASLEQRASAKTNATANAKAVTGSKANASSTAVAHATTHASTAARQNVLHAQRPATSPAGARPEKVVPTRPATGPEKITAAPKATGQTVERPAPSSPASRTRS